ncbi:MAG TPA: sulfate ABC transporter ATP-binding protein [Opitutaceae bacterium]|nr:sulfate ABC transporter ATP-binding protein [Opitutaceae bacterium]
MSVLATNITKHFGSFRALDNVSLEVGAGKLVALLGPSGSGKTTLLRIIAGLEHADAGAVALHGEDVTRTPAGKRRVGFVFQHYALFRHMTVNENVAFGLTVRRRAERPSKSEIADRVHSLLKLVQLEEFGGRFPSQLSGGQRQRIALARALAVEPKVLLLDEPFGALDARVRKDLRRWLRRFHDEIGLTTVFVTHDQEEALEIADEVVVMNNARVEQVGTPQVVYDRPATPFVYQFLGNVNRLNLPWHGYVPETALAAPDGEYAVFVRPHDLEIVRSRSGLGGEPGTVVSVHAAGASANLTCERASDGEHIEVELSRAEFDLLQVRPGDAITLRIRHSRALREEYVI